MRHTHSAAWLIGVVTALVVACSGTDASVFDEASNADGGVAPPANTTPGGFGTAKPPSSDGGSTPGVCGDGLLNTSDEACDDRNIVGGDGCSADCKTVEPGFRCPTPGLRCEASKCGDGIVAGLEECDWPPTGKKPDGCSDTCRIQPGFDCDPKTLACTAVVCGDGAKGRGEQCDDMNSAAFDGCFECRSEPSCKDGVCKAACGDGQRYAGEACDDGNTRGGDGCSATCAIETGFACTDVVAQPPPTIDLPVVIRDFIGKDNELAGAVFHEDFNRHGGSGVLGIVEANLGPDGRPVYNCPGGDCDQNPGHLFIDGGGRPNTSTKANFDQWYRDTAGVNVASTIKIALVRKPNGTYVWDSADAAVNGGKTYFDPIGNQGWVALGKEKLAACGPDRNVSFTSETHFWFEYQGGERFDFAGDDDTWIFLNGKLAIDLGGLHTPRSGYFALDADSDGAGADTADGTASVYGQVKNVTETMDFGLKVGGVYEVVMFQAERNECGSNFKVTLTNFNRPKSACKSTCGDAVVASDEVCDDGKNTGAYGGCMPGCKARAPFCGDGKKDNGEECDDGNTLNSDGCSNGCTKFSVR